METTFIYGLFDPADGVIRYVGKSDDPKQRLAGHIRASIRRKEILPVNHWIRKLNSFGRKPEIVILETVPRFVWEDAEVKWINRLRAKNNRLLNLDKGGIGGHESKIPNEAVARIRFLRHDGRKIADIARDFHLSRATITRICLGKYKTSAGGPIQKGQRFFRKISQKQVVEIRNLYAEGTTQGKLADMFNVCQSTISLIVLGINQANCGGVISTSCPKDHQRKIRKGALAGLAKLTDQVVGEIRRRYASENISQQELANKYGVNQRSISNIVLRKTWKHVE